ncbi:NACHT domain-containing protein [Fusarium keratoplasticum]|uniref:NACHT domain-containing protein n=1 Tax=Fusarium keratoplasticum TaxID=1328300 RepID=A0ACC0R4J5_9HYPO|nr:NACHT domain-containing protein [Fusarium keratoplasticum]KAI8674562.1 NACHT domain-containing protein [Fusarium keratoplasticum]
MDPITALQTASAIIGIVDFGTRLLSSTYEIYQSASGHTAREVGLSTLSEELSGLGKQLQDRLPATSSAASASDRTLQNLSARCVQASNKLHSAIHDLQANRSGNGRISIAANSFASALKAVWNKGEIESLREELIELRSQITFAAIISVLSESKQDGQRHIELKDRLDHITNQLDGRDDNAHQFARELAQITALGNSSDFIPRHTDLVEILWGIDWKSWAAHYEGNLFMDFHSAPHTHAAGLPIPIKILRSLSFRELNSRKEAIPEAYASTCSWIFRDSETDENGEQLEWPSFPTWLEQRDQEIYWITGKPGSGKSTLMKYIIENPELQSHLQEYAEDLPCLKASFFFWNPGSEMETSREGLLRTLLHQCLQGRPDLIPAVAPRRWALYNLLGGETIPPRWTWKELKESFDILCSFHGQEFRLAFFIDGLDEFKECEASPGLLISWIRHTATQYGIKICVSSRPWNVFADAFGREPSLTMQNLSKRDIERFVRTEFDKSIAFQEVKEVFQDDATSIIKEIIEKAQGVFLWVNLVVRNLLLTLIDNPSLADLKRKLAEIPSDIVGLYNAIWLSIPAERHSRSSKILQICGVSLEPCKAVMWLATEDNPNLQAITNAGIHNVMKRVLDGHTRGICELVQDRVQFLHRSAADWVKDGPTRAEICSKAPPDFEPSLNLLEAHIQYQTVMKARGLTTAFGPLELVRILFECITGLYHAVTADRISQLSVRLIQATDDVNKLGYDIAAQGRSFPEWDLAARSKDSTPEGWSTRHWLAQQTGGHSGAENCFVGFTASAGFVDYVKRKIKDEPSLLIPKKGRISILENTIFRHGLGTQPVFPFNPAPSRSSYGTGRLEIIRFILETSPHWYKTAHGKQMLEAVADLESMGNDPEEAKWCQEVLELLEEFEYKSPKFWRRKRDQGILAGPINKASHKTSRLLREFKNELGQYFGKVRREAGG